MLTKPYNFLYVVSHLLPYVYFLYRTGKTFELSLRGGGLPLYDPKDQKHPTEQIAVSEMTYGSLAHGIKEQVLLLLEASWIIVFLLSFWRTVLWPGTGSNAGVSHEAHFLLSRQGTGPDLFRQGSAPTEDPAAQ